MSKFRILKTVWHGMTVYYIQRKRTFLWFEWWINVDEENKKLHRESYIHGEDFHKCVLEAEWALDRLLKRLQTKQLVLSQESHLK